MKRKLFLFLLVLIFSLKVFSPGCKKSPVEPVVIMKKIAFVSDRDGNDEIFIMNTDGSEQANLTNNPDDDRCPVFQP